MTPILRPREEDIVIPEKLSYIVVIMDELENRGIVGPSKGAGPRDILIDLDGTGMDGAGQQAV